MAREKTSHQIIEAVPAGTAGFYERFGGKLRCLAPAAGALALAAGTIMTKPRAVSADAMAPPLEIVELTDSNLLTDSLADAEADAAQDEAVGANTDRVIFPYNQGTAWIGAYGNMICNAAKAAFDHNLKLIIGFKGISDKGQPGFVPESKRDIREFATTIDSIIWTLASKKDETHPGGCEPQQQPIFIEDINEVNNPNPNFNSDFNSQKTPLTTLLRDAYVSNAIKKEAAKPQINAKVVYIGPVLSSANNNPVGFLEAEGKAAQRLNIPNPYDVIAPHPYPKDPTADPAQTVENLYNQLTPVVNQYFKGSKLLLGEYAVNTITPSAQQNNYDPPVSAANGVSEAQQAQYVSNLFKTAVCETGGPKIIGVGNLGVQDDGRGNMRSAGFLYASRTDNAAPPIEKTSYKTVQYVMNAAKNGTLTDCQNQ